MPTLKLEFLRHGPPQNQLLSPLTDYMALCADQPASTVRMPFEHSVLLDRLRALAYKESEERREFRLQNLAHEMSGILAQVPGLIAECSRQLANNGDILQLRLVLSANELALLPFELAVGPVGFPGAGAHLALQTVTPICLTREVRRAAPADTRWPSRAKILFASAAPSGVPEVPTRAHVQALLAALDPWIHHAGTKEPVEMTRDHLTFLPNASADEITNACKTGEYTHVHILAHGVPLEHGDDRRFGLALHHDRDRTRMDIVNGDRLSTALRAHVRNGNRELSRPSVVTLCSCDSGNVGSVVGAGASIAHELHAAGIPLVIASQFPLSVEGSVHLTSVIYGALLKGDDPRVVLNDARRQLRTLVHDRHDWASLVVYASFPSDIERQLRRTKREQAERAIHAALTHIDAASRALPNRKRSTGSTPTNAKDAIEEAEARVREPVATLNYLLDGNQDDTDILGLLASTKKRLGEVYYRGSHPPESGSPTDLQRVWRENAEKYLRQAYRCYVEVFDIDHTAAWALVQSLIVGLAIGREIPDQDYQLATLISQRDMDLGGIRAAWALRNLVELALIEPLGPFTPLDPRPWQDRAMAHLRQLLKLPPPDAEIVSIRAQLDRYRDFFLDKVVDEARESARNNPAKVPHAANIETLVPLAEQIIQRLLMELDSYEGRP